MGLHHNAVATGMQQRAAFPAPLRTQLLSSGLAAGGRNSGGSGGSSSGGSGISAAELSDLLLHFEDIGAVSTDGGNGNSDSLANSSTSFTSETYGNEAQCDNAHLQGMRSHHSPYGVIARPVKGSLPSDYLPNNLEASPGMLATNLLREDAELRALSLANSPLACSSSWGVPPTRAEGEGGLGISFGALPQSAQEGAVVSQWSNRRVVQHSGMGLNLPNLADIWGDSPRGGSPFLLQPPPPPLSQQMVVEYASRDSFAGTGDAANVRQFLHSDKKLLHDTIFVEKVVLCSRSYELVIAIQYNFYQC